MKLKIGFVLPLSAALLGVLAPQPLLAQACKDDETIVEEYKKGMLEFVEAVKKEKLEDFQRAYHQKSCLSKLTFSLSAVNGLVGCLAKAAQDTTATQEEVEVYKAKRATYDKLKGKIEQQRAALKAAEDPKDAKTLVEKLDLST